jgi:hypothetical protein
MSLTRWSDHSSLDLSFMEFWKLLDITVLAQRNRNPMCHSGLLLTFPLPVCNIEEELQSAFMMQME